MPLYPARMPGVLCRRLALGMLMKVSDRLDQAFRVDLTHLPLGFVPLFSCIPRASWIRAPLGFRLVSLIHVHAFPPQQLTR
jgi:hypothetical protein